MKQWRVSWMMWPYYWDRPYSTQKVYDCEEEAKAHIKGLLEIQASHPPQGCDKHVWDIKLEERIVEEWKVKP